MKELDLAIEAAKAAGEVLRAEYQKNHATQYKTDKSLVSEADFAAEKIIINTIQSSFPDHAIFSEEAGLDSTESDSLWIIDPLDGSTNFLHRLNNFCVAIALVKQNQPQFGVVYIPITQELFLAEVGKSASLNGQPCGPSSTTTTAQAMIAWGRGSANFNRHTHLYAAVTHHIRTVRMLGSATVSACFTACGRFDAYLYSDCKLYDALAGAIIAEAAGAKVTDFSGNPWQPDFSDPTSASDILISNPYIQADLIAALKGL